MNLPSPPTAQLVTDNADLQRLCERWLSCTHLALDTEFIRTRTFFPKLGLIQVADPEGIYLLDAVALSEWQPFRDVLSEQAVVKVLHSPSEDFEVFRHALDAVPSPIVDTQVAATLAGVAAMPGYSRLIGDLFDIDLPKGEQRSNWLRRPLSASQMLYAGLDVAYLLPAWEILETALEQKNRSHWLTQEMNRLLGQSEAKNNPETIYLRLSRSNLSELQAGTLFKLVAWRDQQARHRDIPRKFVIGDEVLMTLAKTRPTEMSALEAINGLGRGQRQRMAKAMLEVVASSEPRNLETERIDHAKVSKAKLRPIRECLEEVSDELEIPLTFLASKKVMEKLSRRTSREGVEEVPEELVGWRWETFGERLSSVVIESQE